MKIRTDFVTNSSSSSFVVEIKFTLTSGETVNFRGNGATSESGVVDYFASDAIINVSPKELGTASNIEELILLLTKGVIDDCGPEPVEIFAKPYPLSNSINGKKHDAYNFVGRIRKKIHSMEDIQAIEITGSERNQYRYFQQIYRYDRTTGRYTGLLDGEEIGEIDGEHGGELRFSTVDCLFSGEDDSFVIAGNTGDGGEMQFDHKGPDSCKIEDDTPWEEFNLDDFKWGRYWQGGIELEKYHGHAKYLSIPDRVKWLCYGVFTENSTLLKVKLPRQIDPYSSMSCFCGCKSLVSVILPETRSYVDPSDFKDCENLESIVMPHAVVEIGPGPFINCPKLKVSVPHTLKRVGNSAFLGRNEIMEAVFEAPVQYLRTKAFMDCTNLKTVRFEKGIADFGPDVFKNCTALQEVYIAGNCYKKMSKNIFAGCPDVVIHALPGTMAEEYAKEYGIPFIPIEHNVSGKAFVAEKEKTVVAKPQSLCGLTFVVTGDLKNFPESGPYPARAGLKKLIEEHGGKLVGSVSGKTNYLICNDASSGTTKVREAKMRGVPIITEDEFMKMIDPAE